MSCRFYIIIGPPGSGKSVLLESVLKQSINGFDCEILTKQTTRRKRINEGIEIAPVNTQTSIGLHPTKGIEQFAKQYSMYYTWNGKAGRLTLRGPMPYEEVQELLEAASEESVDKHAIDKLYRNANILGKRCDVVYEQYTRRYGFAVMDVIAAFGRKNSVIAIVNDIRAVRELKSRFGRLAIVIYLHRPLNTDIASLQRNRGASGADGGVDVREIEKRTEKAKVILRRYIDNIEIFDHVILNSTNKKRDLVKQMIGIIRMHQIEEARRKFVTKEGLFA